MSTAADRGPKPAERLYEGLFLQGGDAAFEKISNGFPAFVQNSSRLLGDVQHLLDGERFASARFLLTTAREEIAKAFVLADMCRLDVTKHSSVLRTLCGAFYDHIAKHAYLKVSEFSPFRSLTDAQGIWDVEVRRWWPGDYESGEPDLPHSTYFDREFPLYVDYGYYPEEWHIPDANSESVHFRGPLSLHPLGKTQALIDGWKAAINDRLCSPEALRILNTCFKARYVRVPTSVDELAERYRKAERQMQSEIGISEGRLLASPMAEWPLYDFVSNRMR